MTSRGKPLLDEMEACKVAGQILEGFLELADLNIWHNDFSVNNFVVDQELNVSDTQLMFLILVLTVL
jgi:RIO-like serine/threonine protein kinase